MTVGELLARAGSREITEWMALYLLEHEEEAGRELERRNAANKQAVLSRPPRRH